MEIQQLRHFVAVARYGHLGKAAEEQRLTQSGITRSIQSLEEFLGVSLLRRTPRGVVLTPVGKELVRHAEAIINQRERALEAVGTFMKGDAGAVTIGMTDYCDFHFMPELTARLFTNHPRLRLHLKSGTYMDLIEALRMGEVEFVIGLINPTFHHPEVTIEELFITRSVVACRPSHPLAQKANVTLADLSAALWAMPSGRGLQHAFQGFFHAHRSPYPEQVIQTNSLAFLQNLVQRLDLLTVVPWQIGKADVMAGRLHVLNIDAPGDFARFGVARLTGSDMSLAAEIAVKEIYALADQVRPTIAEGLATTGIAV